MKIIRLTADNFKRLRAVEIRPDGSIVEIRGANRAGKSSVLDSIAAALGGEKLCPAVPIRIGAETASAEVELDDGTTIERRWTASGSRLAVKNRDGLRYPNPQKLLDGLVGKLSFDPLAFLHLAAKEQTEALRRIAGVDFTPLDERRKAAYDARTSIHRQIAQAKARLAALPVVVAPDALVSGADLFAEQERRQKVKGANDLVRRDLERARDMFQLRKGQLAEAAATVERARAALAEAEERERAAEAAVEEALEAGKTSSAHMEALVEPDMEEIPRRLRDLEAVNDRVRAKQKRAALAADVTQAEGEAKKFDAAIAAIDQEKAAALAQANFPVEGLGFTDSVGPSGRDTTVTLNGLPFDQAAFSEQIRVSLAMGVALNPKLRVMLIRDASCLDEKSMRLVAEMAEANDCQVWLEIVAKDEGVGIFIEDGEVVGGAVSAAPVEAAHAS